MCVEDETDSVREESGFEAYLGKYIMDSDETEDMKQEILACVKQRCRRTEINSVLDSSGKAKKMKIQECYVENFGGLSGYHFCPEEPLEYLCAPNGSGKTTFAAFVCAMVLRAWFSKNP